MDFENAAPTETEREIYDEVERVLRESESVLDEIQCYKVRCQSPISHLLRSLNCYCTPILKIRNGMICGAYIAQSQWRWEFWILESKKIKKVRRRTLHVNECDVRPSPPICCIMKWFTHKP